MAGSRGTVGAGALLEREAELATVTVALARATRGEGTMVAIEGAAGLGKTSLLETGSERAVARRHRVLAARGEDLERGLPWGLARRLLAPALAGPGSPALAGGAAAAGRCSTARRRPSTFPAPRRRSRWPTG